jgi:hypothetical protein
VSEVRSVSRFLPRRETISVLGALCAVEFAVLAAYLATMPVSVTMPRYVLYPFVWVNASVLAVWRVRARRQPNGAASARRRRLAALVGAGYFLALAWVGGVLAWNPMVEGVTVYWRLPPGWGPMAMAGVGPVRLAVTPYRVVGYLALAYLVYATLLETKSGLAGGLVGLFSCVSCTLPLLATLVSGLAGGALAVGAASAWSLDLSTAVFLLAVALLVWRPGFGLVQRAA